MVAIVPPPRARATARVAPTLYGTSVAFVQGRGDPRGRPGPVVVALAPWWSPWPRGGRPWPRGGRPGPVVVALAPWWSALAPWWSPWPRGGRPGPVVVALAAWWSPWPRGGRPALVPCVASECMFTPALPGVQPVSAQALA